MPRNPDPYVRAALIVKRSAIDGKGVFAAATIAQRRKLGEFTGEIISQREGRERAKNLRRISIVEVNHGKAVDASRGGNLFRYVNHSCSPNTFIRIFGLKVEIYALRTIRAGEELTCDYGESHHDGQHPCGCRSPKCRKFI